MRSSNKSRSRNNNNKNHNNNNRRNSGGNIVNRVFDSSGPEGKVRGTPQQVIEKYQSLADDAQRSGDRIAAENFLQHSEHYARMLGEAQREINVRRDAMESQRQANPNPNQNHQIKQGSDGETEAQQAGTSDQPDVSMVAADDLFPTQAADDNLVATPESKQSEKKASRPPRAPRKPCAPKPTETVSETPDAAPDAAE